MIFSVRKSVNKRKLFPTDDAAKKVIYLAIQQASKNGLFRLGVGK